MSRWRRQLKKRHRLAREFAERATTLIEAMERLSDKMDEAIDNIRYNMAWAELKRFEREIARQGRVR